MRRRFTNIGALTVLLAVGLAAQVNSQSALADNVPQITYVANEGFLVEHGGAKVLVDSLFDTGASPFLTPSQVLLAQLTEARGLFANVDLLLVTHSHADHFNPKLVAAHLRNNPRCRLIAHTQAVDPLRQEEGFAQIQDRIHEIKLEPGSREQVTIDGIVVEVLALAHGPDDGVGSNSQEQVRNLAFIVNLGGIHFLHLGDATVEHSLVHLNAYPFDETPVDLLFLNYLDRSQATREFIARKIKPSRIVAMHVPPAEWADKENAVLEAYPYAVLFRQSEERRSLSIGIDYHRLTGAYLGQPLPGATPTVFAPEIVSTAATMEHRAPSFSPDGNEVFWYSNRWPDEGPSLSVTMRLENGRWSAPWAVPLGLMPVLSPDGRRVYFYADTPGPSVSQEGQSYLDIWYAEKKGDGWGEPQCVNLVARYPELRLAFQPTLTRNGTIYFMAYAPSPQNDGGIYRAELINGEYAKPELLPRNINLPPFLNWAPFIAPDESYLLFSSNRTGSLDDVGDLYFSCRQADGSWTDPFSLGEPVNTRSQEVFPGLSPDGKYLFFCRYTSDRKNEVYWVDARSILPNSNGPIFNLSTGQRFGLIQTAVNYAEAGQVILISPGTYNENLTLPNKPLTIRSANPRDSAVVSLTTLAGTVTLAAGTAQRSIQGLTIAGGTDGIVCPGAKLQLSSCVITGHRDCGVEVSDESTLSMDHCTVAGNGGAGLRSTPVKGRRVLYSKVDLAQCTFAQNRGYALDGDEFTITNSILCGNGHAAGNVQITGGNVTVSYSDIQNGFGGLDNFDADPLFVATGTWTDPNTYVPGDYHLKSQAGHWDSTNSSWVLDDATSLCIDAGDPNASFGLEPVPNGGRVNLGAYGNTIEASKSMASPF